VPAEAYSIDSGSGPTRDDERVNTLIDQVKLQAFDLSSRTARAGRADVTQRVERLRSRAFLIVQCAVTAGLAWWLCQQLLGHQLPYFGPVGAIITLGITFGQRLRRGIDVALGVAVGVFTGDLFVHLVGSGVWQIVLVAAVAMTLATLLGAGQIMIIQAGVQSIIVSTLLPASGQGFNRWLDAVVGCALALLVATLAPSAPVRKPRVVAAQVLTDIADTLRAAEKALRSHDAEAADAVLEQARAGEKNLDALTTAAAEGLAVVRHSPFRRRQLPLVVALSDFQDPLDHATRNLRVLARRCAVALWRGETVPLSYLVLLDQVAEVTRFMANELFDGRLPTAARPRLIAIGRDSSNLKLRESLSAVVVLAQLRSMLTDLLELTGMDYSEARVAIPEMH
jgi:uncharacterized membrane protein YgaE (UPF0421/DUF939 family)